MQLWLDMYSSCVVSYVRGMFTKLHAFPSFVPILMNWHIKGGWKYVNDQTGEFFS